MKKFVLSLFLAVAILSAGGCAMFEGGTKKPSYPVSVTAEMRQEFQNADQLFFASKFDQAAKLYQTYVASYGYNELTDAARFKLGEISFMKRRYEEAITYYKEAFQNIYNPDVAPKAQFKAALSMHNLGRNEQVLGIINEIKRKDLSPVLALRTDSLAVNASKILKKDRNEAVKWSLFLLDDYDKAIPSEYEGKIPEKLVSRDVAHKEVVAWVQNGDVSKTSVEALPMKEMKGKTSGGYVAYKLALINYSQGDFSEASKLLGQYVRQYPKHEFAADGSRLLAELKGKTSGKSYKIGVILPVSGRFALYGNSTLHGIQCAAGLKSPCTSPYNIELLVKDSEGGASAIENAVAELDKEGAIAIIGPLLSSTVSEAAVKAQELKIPMISLSQKEGVAETGNFIFQHALTPEDMVDTLAEYAVGKRKIKRFGIVFPNNKYGTHFSGLFREAVDKAGGKIVFQKGYLYSDLRVEKPMGSETDGMDASAESSSEKGKVSFEVPSGVEAIFIPDSYKAVKYVVGAIEEDSKNLSSNVLYLGINRWNNPGLFSGGRLNGSIFVDGFFKRSADVTTRNFVQSFTSAFGMEPTILEAQGFDALKIVTAGIGNGGTNRAKLSKGIEKVKNLGVATGSVNIDNHGNSRRKLFILTVRHGDITEASNCKDAEKSSSTSPSQKEISRQNSVNKYGDGEAPSVNMRADRSKYDQTNSPVEPLLDAE